MKLSIAAAIIFLTSTSTANARLHHPDMVERSLANPAITKLQGDIDRLEAANVTLHDQIYNTQTAIDTANAEITELRSDVDRLEAANVTLHDQIATADTAIATANANITALASRLEAAEATIIVLTAHVKVTQRIVFVTSETYSSGAIGGIAGAHSKCQTLAIEAGLNGKFKPWLSSSTYWPAKNFYKSDVPYVTTNGTNVADDWQDLITDDGKKKYLDNAIAFDEKGVSSTGDVWTGTSVNGMPISALGDFCDDWTKGRDNARIGDTTSTLGGWTSGSTSSCLASLRLYCFEQ